MDGKSISSAINLRCVFEWKEQYYKFVTKGFFPQTSRSSALSCTRWICITCGFPLPPRARTSSRSVLWKKLGFWNWKYLLLPKDILICMESELTESITMELWSYMQRESLLTRPYLINLGLYPTPINSRTRFLLIWGFSFAKLVMFQKTSSDWEVFVNWTHKCLLSLSGYWKMLSIKWADSSLIASLSMLTTSEVLNMKSKWLETKGTNFILGSETEWLFGTQSINKKNFINTVETVIEADFNF